MKRRNFLSLSAIPFLGGVSKAFGTTETSEPKKNVWRYFRDQMPEDGREFFISEDRPDGSRAYVSTVPFYFAERHGNRLHSLYTEPIHLTPSACNERNTRWLYADEVFPNATILGPIGKSKQTKHVWRDPKVELPEDDGRTCFLIFMASLPLFIPVHHYEFCTKSKMFRGSTSLADEYVAKYPILRWCYAADIVPDSVYVC